MTIDLSKISPADQPPVTAGLPQRKHFTREEDIKAGEENVVPQNAAAKEHRKSHWEIDKVEQDGQVRAGEVDANHEEFLKNTEMVE